MLSETALLTMVQVGVTGAGLVLAIYTLIIPISRRMFNYRAKLLYKQITEFKKQNYTLTPEATNKEFKRLRQLSKNIRETRIFPRYLGVGVLFTFFSYILLALLGFVALNPINRTNEIEFFIALIFFVAIFSFLSLGIFTIYDISNTMKNEYERIKKKIEEDEKNILLIK